MGASTYTATILHQDVWGSKKVSVVAYHITSYGTDGVLVDSAHVGLDKIDDVLWVVNRTKVGNGPVTHVFVPSTGYLTFLKATDTGVNATTAFDVDVVVIGD